MDPQLEVHRRDPYTGRGNLSVNQSFNVDTTPTPTRFRLSSWTTGGRRFTGTIRISPVLIEILSDEVANDFDISDIIVSGACVDRLQHIVITERNRPVSNKRWLLYITLDNNTSGSFRVSIPRNTVSIGNEAVSQRFTYDRTTASAIAAIPELRDARQNSDGTGIIPKTNGKLERQTMYIPIAFGPNS